MFGRTTVADPAIKEDLAATFTRRPPSGPTAQLLLAKSTRGGSNSFLVRADDRHRYWCKASNNNQGAKILVTEEIVGRFGQLIGAAVCSPQLIRIPVALSGVEYGPGLPLLEGWAHGSRAEKPVVETNALGHRTMDDNPRRHASIFAVYDWLWGGDEQWLVKTRAESMYFSHDHGWYLPPTGPDWTVASLRADVATPHPYAGSATDLDSDELRRLADALEALSTDQLEDAVANLPSDWPADDAELQEVARFAVTRAPAVAGRLRALAP